MFDFRGYIQALGVSLIVTIVVAFFIGFLGVLSADWMVITSFIVSYVTIGIVAPLWNRKTPYFAAFLGSITLTVINLIFSYFILTIPVLLDPIMINSNLIYSTITSLITAVVFMFILNRNERLEND